jgi:hypothetical protein
VHKYVRGTMFGFCSLIVAIQFIRPARTNPPVIQANTLEANVSVPPAVERILTAACNDCHSNQTRWPWYSEVAPISWFVINHVNEGRQHMNFSEWQRPQDQGPARLPQRRRRSACSEVQTGAMPLFSYRLIHRDSRLTPEDVQTFCQWANGALE